jgi:hypothetical protein
VDLYSIFLKFSLGKPFSDLLCQLVQPYFDFGEIFWVIHETYSTRHLWFEVSKERRGRGIGRGRERKRKRKRKRERERKRKRKRKRQGGRGRRKRQGGGTYLNFFFFIGKPQPVGRQEGGEPVDHQPLNS